MRDDLEVRPAHRDGIDAHQHFGGARLRHGLFGERELPGPPSTQAFIRPGIRSPAGGASRNALAGAHAGLRIACSRSALPASSTAAMTFV